MKKNLVLVALVLGIFCSMSFAPRHREKTDANLKAPLVNYTVTLTGSNNTGISYRIVFTNSSYDKQFPMPINSSSTISVPAGVYTVSIAPVASMGTYHTYSGSSCTLNYSGSGNYVSWGGVNICNSSAQFSMN